MTQTEAKDCNIGEGGESVAQANILVVEDNNLVCMTIRDILQEEGYRVQIAENAKQAKHVLKNEPFDLILLDMMLPDADGRKLLTQWRKEYPQTNIVIFTAHGDVSSAVECVKQGAYDFLTKPVEKAELLTTIRNALEH
ncbi:MAG: response regulator, partial [Lentisphaerae bacterium]